jgi:hypothetical protein
MRIVCSSRDEVTPGRKIQARTAKKKAIAMVLFAVLAENGRSRIASEATPYIAKAVSPNAPVVQKRRHAGKIVRAKRITGIGTA